MSPPPLRLLALAVLVPVLGACASVQHRWAEVTIHELSYQNIYSSVLDMLELEGFGVSRRLPDEGRIETEWFTGDSRREFRGPSRRRVHVEIRRKERDDGYVVRMRVQEQVVPKGGTLGGGQRFRESDWEDFPDSFEDAEYMAAKLRALLSKYTGPRSVSVETEGAGP